MANRNPSPGHKSDKLWRDAIMLAVKWEAEKGGKTKKLAQLADVLVDKALSGDVGALKEIGDRMDGKPAQSVALSGDKDNPITVIERTIVKASDSNG